MTNKKIIFFDIDGTIIEEDTYKISQSTVDAIRKARENGHYAVINTGRTKFLMDGEIKEKIGFDGYLLGCGTEVIFQDKELLHRTLPTSLVKKLIKQLRICKIDGVLESSKKDYIDYPENMCAEAFREFICKMRVKNGYWDDEGVEADKLFLCTNEDSDMESFQKMFCRELDFIDREKGYWEIIPTGCSKASGIQYLIDYLGMPIEATVAIGDSNNDISMLNYANTSIAMGNATKAVLDMATYITSDVHDNGIENALKWLGVIS